MMMMMIAVATTKQRNQQTTERQFWMATYFISTTIQFLSITNQSPYRYYTETEMSTNVNPQQLQTLREMGIDEDIASKALQYTNGDVNRAIECVFDGSLPEFGATEPNVTFKNIEPGILDTLPQLPPRSAAGNSSDSNKEDCHSSQHVEYVNGKQFDAEVYLNEPNHTNHNTNIVQYPVQESYSIYEDVNRYKNEQPSHPSIIMPPHGGYWENYLVYMVCILHQIPEFRRAVLSYKFEDFGYDPEWFKGKRIFVDPGIYTVEKEGVKHDYRFLLELQRLFIFLDEEKSQRFFTSSRQFILNIPQKFLCESSSLFELIDCFIRWIIDELKEIEINVEDLLVGKFVNADQTQIRDIISYEVALENLRYDVHQTFLGMLWDSETNRMEYSYEKVSDVMIFVIEQDMESNDYSGSSGVRLEERFHPSLFTEGYADVITELVAHEKKMKKSIKRHQAQLLNYKSFNGKSVSNFLTSTKDFLAMEGFNDELDELKSIEFSFSQDQKALDLKIEEEIRHLDSLTPSDINNILNKGQKRGLEPADSWILTGVTISRTSYYVQKIDKVHKKRKWYFIQSIDDQLKDVKIEQVEFHEVQLVVKRLTDTQILKEPLVVTYTKETAFKNLDLDMNYGPAILEFIEFDEANLEAQISAELPDYDDASQEDLLEFSEDDTPASETVEVSDENKLLIIDDMDLEECQNENEDSEKSKIQKPANCQNDTYEKEATSEQQ